MEQDPSQTDQPELHRPVPVVADSSSELRMGKIMSGPLREETRRESKSLVLVSAVALAAQSGQVLSILSLLSNPLGFKAKAVPFLLMVVVFYLLTVFVIHTLLDVLRWWPSWCQMRKSEHGSPSRFMTILVGVRFALEVRVASGASDVCIILTIADVHEPVVNNKTNRHAELRLTWRPVN